MGTPKEEVLKMIQALPDNTSMEDIQYHLYVREKAEKGLVEVREGHVIPLAEVEKRMSKWLGK